MTTEPLTPQSTITKGDRVLLTFSIRSFAFMDKQVKALEEEVNRDPRFQVLYTTLEGDYLYVHAKVLKDPLPLLVLIGLITGAAGLLMLFINFEKAEKVIVAVPAVLKAASTGAVAVAVIVALVLFAPYIKAFAPQVRT